MYETPEPARTQFSRAPNCSDINGMMNSGAVNKKQTLQINNDIL